ncbi:MAG: hypothetical protein ACODAA_06670 [Gemmatimonadota bacterium]
MEQFTALVLDIARALGQAYASLIEAGVPADFAKEIVERMEQRIFRGEFDEAEDYVRRIREGGTDEA